MPSIEAQTRLLAELEKHIGLRSRGYEFSISSGVLVERQGHARGIWRCNSRGFTWTPAGYNEPVDWVEDVEAAIRYTIKLFS